MVSRQTVQGRSKDSKAVAYVWQFESFDVRCHVQRAGHVLVRYINPRLVTSNLPFYISVNVSLNSKSKMHPRPIYGCLFSAQNMIIRNSMFCPLSSAAQIHVWTAHGRAGSLFSKSKSGFLSLFCPKDYSRPKDVLSDFFRSQNNNRPADGRPTTVFSGSKSWLFVFSPKCY